MADVAMLRTRIRNRLHTTTSQFQIITRWRTLPIAPPFVLSVIGRNITSLTLTVCLVSRSSLAAKKSANSSTVSMVFARPLIPQFIQHSRHHAIHSNSIHDHYSVSVFDKNADSFDEITVVDSTTWHVAFLACRPPGPRFP